MIAKSAFACLAVAGVVHVSGAGQSQGESTITDQVDEAANNAACFGRYISPGIDPLANKDVLEAISSTVLQPIHLNPCDDVKPVVTSAELFRRFHATSFVSGVVPMASAPAFLIAGNVGSVESPYLGPMPADELIVTLDSFADQAGVDVSIRSNGHGDFMHFTSAAAGPDQFVRVEILTSYPDSGPSLRVSPFGGSLGTLGEDFGEVFECGCSGQARAWLYLGIGPGSQGGFELRATASLGWESVELEFNGYDILEEFEDETNEVSGLTGVRADGFVNEYGRWLELEPTHEYLGQTIVVDVDEYGSDCQRVYLSPVLPPPETGCSAYLVAHPRGTVIADVNCDFVVDAEDVEDVMFWMQHLPDCDSCEEDINQDGIIDALDLLIVLREWTY